MNYKSFEDLSRDIKTNLYKIPKDVTLIVGIPRSGLLAANLISLYANLPLTDIDNFIQGKVLCSSYQDEFSQKSAFKGKILIVDDSVATGKAILDAREKLKSIIDSSSYELLFCCIYADPEKKHLVDISFMLLNRPRVFEWNLFHNKIMEKSGITLSGVLAIMPQSSKQTELKKHSNFLLQALPFIIPKKKIGTLIHTVEETDLESTENWLKENRVQYDELLVKENINIPLEYKKRKNLTFFITSSKQEAQEIFEKSGKNVYCLESNMLLSKEPQMATSKFQSISKRLVNKLKRKLKTFS